MIDEKPIPIRPDNGVPDFAWAVMVHCYVESLKRLLGVEEIVFVGAPAEQWRVACGILHAASR